MSWMFHFNSDSVVYEGEEAYLPGFREPYVHNYVGEEIKCIIPASGMVTALDPIIRAGGG